MNEIDEQALLNEIHSLCVNNINLTQEFAKRFFKTSAGGYGESDQFLGITVPALREIAREYQHVDSEIIEGLLESKFNEERLLALIILVHQYRTSDNVAREEKLQFYLKNLKYVNNWNLVDSSAHLILGHYLWDKDRSILAELAKSSVLWERRIAIVATWYFIRQDDTSTTFQIAKLLLSDEHGLIHKAVGWMLREAGKRDEAGLISFLSNHAKHMPKTMLRYAMEKLAIEQKKAVLN